MARVQKPPAGKAIVSIIYSSMDALADAVKVIEKKLGRVAFETIEIPCSKPEIYREEMGDTLLRRFYSFERETPREALVELKHVCHKIEPLFADNVDDFCFRTVNIDPGIVTPASVIMASHKEYNHSVYLRDGVFAELTLVHARGRFVRLPWTDMDFCHEEAIGFFDRVRSSFEIRKHQEEPARL